MIPARVITVSDRCSAGLAEDLSGPLAARLLADHGVEASVRVVPDEVDAIRAAITAAVEDGARFVFTTGGTGLAPRDVTPEATEPLLVTRIDGLADAIRRRGEEKVASAALSRGLVGVTARSPEGALVVNAPGSRGGVTDAVAVIGPLGHTFALKPVFPPCRELGPLLICKKYSFLSNWKRPFAIRFPYRPINVDK